MKILYAASECAPFVKTGGLADVAGSLPKALCEAGCETRVILPLYDTIEQKWRDKMTFLFSTEVFLVWRRLYCGVFGLNYDGVEYYFVDNEYYFMRGRIYGEFDDGERFAFFSRAVIELLPMLDFAADVVSCNDWQTALIPIYLRSGQSPVKSVFTIHNIEYQGRFNLWTAQDVFGLSPEFAESGILRFENDVDLMKGAIYQSDYVTTVSPSYAQELKYPEHAHGLHMVIQENSFKLAGILNGIDVTRYDPATDGALPFNYSAENLTGKALCKEAMCRELGLSDDPDTPIIACVSRLVGHKGFDLVAAALDEIVSRGAKLVILGTGEEKYENFFRDAENRYKGRVCTNIMYSEKRAMLIYSGADMFLMPSKSEPCGLSQMIAMRYGAVPIVRETGGLRDTVHNLGGEGENGFSFVEYSTNGLLGAVDFALRTLQNDQGTWQRLIAADMTADLGWDASAARYIEIYRFLLGN
ncbi:MAG: glycogen synthase [Clostridia bacterium]|nr:glycogen synthase [Clostridia bacterium]